MKRDPIAIEPFQISKKPLMLETSAKKLGADLPVIKSTEENTFFLKLTEDRGETWLGMYAEN